MNRHPKAEMLTYAPDASGNLVYIGRLKESGRTDCHCPKCNEPLIAKLGHGGRQRHFAHYKDSDCHGSYMTVLHMLAEQIISEEKAVMVPEYKGIKAQRLLFREVEDEKRNDRKDLQPDRVGITDDNKRWCIEIRNTHEVDEAKIAKYKESSLTCLEIDVRKQTLDKEALKNFLLESTDDREWINNPFYDELIADAEREKVVQVVRLLEEKRELPIQPEKIRLEEVSASISEDGLYAMVQAVSGGGKHYICHIGSEDKLMGVRPQKVCDELKFNTTLFHSDEQSFSSCVEWFYRHVPPKAQEEKNDDYSKNPDYEIRFLIDCIFDCHLKPYKGQCIYMKDTFEKDGLKRVVCNKAKREKEAPRRPQISNDSSNHVTSLFGELKGKERKVKKKEVEKNKKEQQDVEDSLPFKPYWTVEDYLKKLQSTGCYKRYEDDNPGEIVKCDKSGDIILVFYKQHVSNGRVNEDLFYIDKVKIEEGEPTKITVDYYDSEDWASKEYSQLKDRLYTELGNMDYHDDLPF